MVVISIFAIITAIAIPTYKGYVTKARLLEVSKVLGGYLDQARQAAVNGTAIPSTINELVSGTAVEHTVSSLIDEIYYNNGSGWVNVGKAAMVQAIVSTDLGNSIGGFVAGDAGANNRLTVAFVIRNGNLEMFCGNWEDSANDIPVEYLPKGCDSVNFAADVQG